MNYRWHLRDVKNPDAVANMQEILGDLPKALARALVVRGIDTFEAARRFFRPSLDELHDPLQMQDMERASERLARAVREREGVMVYGDYDVDGTTATAVLTHFLRARGLDADFFIPSRFTHGYGFHRDGVDKAAEFGATLLITVDCGVTSLDVAAYARERGIDLIICDHHRAGDEVPEAVAVLDPQRPSCAYPFKDLSGCGVAWKLVRATLEKLGEAAGEADAYLDLVALSTACDVVALKGENRILLREGKRRLRESARPGLRALARVAKIDLALVSDYHLGFVLGPRINAVGRMADGAEAVRLFLSETEEEAAGLAEVLDRANRDRRLLNDTIRKQALKQAEDLLLKKPRHAIVVHHEDWHKGVLGIVAARLVERYHRPAVVLASENGEATGSARTIAGIDILSALRRCEDLLLRFGGHAQAAGMTLAVDNVDAFRDRLSDVVGERLTPELMTPAIEYDAELDLSRIDRRFMKVLEQFEPFGNANPEPVFACRGLRILSARTLSDGRHLKLRVRPSEESTSWEVVAFNQGEKIETVEAARECDTPLDLLCAVEKNVWQNRARLQLHAKDIRLAATP